MYMKDQIDVKKDTERSETIRAMKKAWEDAEPGRAAKAKQSSIKYLNSHLVKVKIQHNINIILLFTPRREHWSFPCPGEGRRRRVRTDHQIQGLHECWERNLVKETINLILKIWDKKFNVFEILDDLFKLLKLFDKFSLNF